MTYAPFAPVGVDATDAPLLAQQSMERADAVGATANASGDLVLTYFRAYTNAPLATARAYTGATAAAATPTLCRLGLYRENGDRTLDLIAAITTDTALYATINTEYSRALTTGLGVRLELGARYAAASIITSGAAMPTILGTPAVVGGAGAAAMQGYSPRQAALFAGQTNLPDRITDAQQAAAAVRQYIAFGTS